MSNRVNQLTTLGVFMLGFLLGGASLLFFTSNNGSQLSSFSLRSKNNIEAGVAPSDHRRGLQSLTGFTDPRSITQKTAPIRLPQEEASTRYVHVGSMCRCASGLLPVPGPIMAAGHDTQIVQPPSIATGRYDAKHFVLHGSEGGCSCIENSGRNQGAETTTDMFLKKLKRKCPNPQYPTKYDWDDMPDLGVEESLPIFVGVLSYESPLSLNGTLHNWLDHDLFRRIHAQDVFVQLNHRSQLDDEIMQEFQESQRLREQQSPITVLGSPEDNLHPGLALSNMCRRAEAHPNSHPNGENLLMFLEKDWNLYNGANDVPRNIEALFRGINALAQRGVPYIRLKQRSGEVKEEKMWKCSSQGFPFECTHAHQHRWTNQPMVISCKWFLRYLEPFALLDDPIMYGCREGFQENRYCDWEEAAQDGRIAWSNSQWVSANLVYPQHRLFVHKEVDQ
eukprot:CAMPEP_0201897404 /NCGR_PEP_ID=MMETSP0902-20130614/46484_1 /ASSEMBLY_ACC=CAM_ASM_000551 /TAXON_ID=420261 /ORGANISM="Thalassiosira antarctica, Strain CCMP982" /LENGTH=448 /DNA_ID=CAMNT_0048430261 /DNA_START=33 /DNA_END=1379 /DNA_ORIENTATION=-